MERTSIKAWCVVATATIAALSSTTARAAITVTRADTFNPGIFWASFTYRWTINVGPDKGPYDDYEVWSSQPGWLANLDTTSYSGPGDVAGPQPAGGIRVRTLAPGGFVPPTTGSIESISNPNFVAGKLNFRITLQGVPVNNPVIASLLPLPGNATTTAGSTQVVYPPGTFPPSVPIDLFQNTSLVAADARLGFATTDPSGGATVPLSRSLLDPNNSELVVGLSGQLVYSVPAPGWTGPMALMGVLALRRRR